MTKQEALDWFKRRAESITLSDKCAEAEKIAADCILESISREPHVLTLDEVKTLGDRERTMELTTDIEPVWVEERNGQQTRIEIGLVWYDSFNEEWMGKDEWTIYVKRFGTDYDTILSVLDYGKTWRVWSALTTREQRKAVKWDG